MSGKTVIITGGNSGIGKATALELIKMNAKVIIACRDLVKGQAAVNDIQRKTSNGEIILKPLDLASLASVRTFANEILQEEDRIDVLINNAGVFQCPFSKTEDGFETQMGVNHLGHFYLTNLLLDKLKSSNEARILIISSSLAKRGTIEFDNLNSEKGYEKRKGYSNSKLACNLFARELAKRTEGSGLGVMCIHPGMVHTSLGRHVMPPAPLSWLLYPVGWLLLKSPQQGAAPIVQCAIDPCLRGVSGYFGPQCTQEKWPTNSLDDGLAQKLWEVSERLTGL
jgi:retinol dehydrogenase-14